MVTSDEYGNQKAVVPDDLRIDMDSGHDTVIMHDLHVTDDAYIDTGSGNDLIDIRDSYFGFRGDDGGNNDLQIRARSGYDRVALHDVAIQDDLVLYGENSYTSSGLYVGDNTYT